MTHYRTDEEVHNYDIFKGVVVALLLVTLFLSAMLGIDESGDAAAPDSETGTAGEVSEAGETSEDEIAGAPESSEIMAPDLLSPAPGSELEPGPQTFSGMGTPNSQVALVAGGAELGRTAVDENGTWQLDVDLPAGTQSIQLQAMDSDGNVAASSEEIPMTAGPSGSGAYPGQEEAAQAYPGQEETAQAYPGQEETAQAYPGQAESGDAATPEAPSFTQPESAIPDFNPLTGTMTLEGQSGPGARVAAIVDDQIVDEVTANDVGRWKMNLSLAPGAYSLAFGQLDEDGNLTSSSQAVAINVPGEMPRFDLPDYSLPDRMLAALATLEAAQEDDTGETTTEEATEEAADEASPVKDFLDSIGLPQIKLPAGITEWTGTAEPGTEVAVVVDGQVAGTTTADEEGKFTLAGDLAEGARKLQLGIVGEDGALIARSRMINISVADMELPTVQLPELSGGEETVTLGGTAEPGSTVEITADGETVGEATADADGAWSFDLAPFAEAVRVRVQAIGEDGLPVLLSSPVLLPGIGQAVAEAPAEGEAEAPAEGEAEEPDEDEADEPTEGEAEEEDGTGVTGTVTYLERIALPGDAVVTVQIINLSLADVSAEVLGEQIIEADDRQVPIPYKVPYSPEEIDENLLYGVSARIESSEGTLLFINDTNTLVITNDNPTEEVEIVTVQVKSVASDAELGQAETDLEESADNVLEAMEASGQFTILLEGLEAAGLTDRLAHTEEAYTVFAPTDEAFESLPPGVLAGWAFNPEEFANILRNEVIEGRYAPEDLTDGLVLRSVADTNIGITRTGDLAAINGVPIIDGVPAGESYVYALPQVILPPLPAGISAPIIDASGVPVFIGEILTVVGVAEPGQRIVLTINDEQFGNVATVDPNGFWLVSDEIVTGIHNIIAHMIDDDGLLRALSQEVTLAVPES